MIRNDANYLAWRRQFGATAPAHLHDQRARSARWLDAPLVSIITPTFDPPVDVLRALVESVRAQTYGHWELILGDFGDSEEIRAVMRAAAHEEDRIRIVSNLPNRGIATNSNRCARVATGKYIALLDHDDSLAPEALFASVEALEESGFTFVYSDEDRVDEKGNHFHPFFKPDWSPAVMTSANYIAHFAVFRRCDLVDVGGWESSFDGAQDWDLFLRLIDLPQTKVGHVPQVLYHWRSLATSTAATGLLAKPYAARSQVRSIEAHLQRKSFTADVAQNADGTIALQFPRDSKPRIMRWRHGDTKLDVDLGFEAEGDPVIVYVHGDSELDSATLASIAGWASRATTGIVGCNAVDSSGHLLGPGLLRSGDLLERAFAGMQVGAYTVEGSSGWNRNYVSVSPELFAVRRSVVERYGCEFLAVPNVESAIRLHVSVWNAGLENIAIGSVISKVAELPSQHIDPVVVGWPEEEPYRSLQLRMQSMARWLDGREWVGKITCNSTDSNLHKPSDLAFASEFRLDMPPQLARLNLLRNRIPLADSSSWAIFVPPFDSVYAGAANILRFADHLCRRGMRVTIVVSHHNLDGVPRLASEAFPLLGRATFLCLEEARTHLPVTDVGVATFWQTAFDVMSFEQLRRTAYFIQDDESMFYPAGSESALASYSYSLPLVPFTNSASLLGVGGIPPERFAVLPTLLNLDKYRSVKRRPCDRQRVLFYGRPQNIRNGFEIGMRALRLLKQAMGDEVEVLTAGDTWQPRSEHDASWVRDLGKVPFAELPELYGSCSAGLFLMFSRHPGVVPMEWMASGLPFVINDAQSAFSPDLYRDQSNCLVVPPIPSAVADALYRLLVEPNLAQAIVLRGRQTLSDLGFDYAERADEVVDHIHRGLV